jgi:DNA polymerase-3 subunit beta
MKFKTQTIALKEVVSSVSRVVNPRPSTPALTGLYLQAVDGFVEMIGSDLDITIKSRISVDVDVEGNCLVNSNKLSEIVRKLPEGEVVFSDVGSELKIETKSLDFTLRKLEDQDYPEAFLKKHEKDEQTQEVLVSELFDSLKNVGIASTPEGGRPVLTGVYFNNQDEKTELAATDSYRLATQQISNFPINDVGIISFKDLYFFNDKYFASLRKVEGTFPEYQNLFPKETLFTAEIDKKEILESLDRSTVVAEGYIPVTFIFESNEKLTITTLNKDVGGGNESLNIKILGVETGDINGFQMSFNPNFLIQGIEVLEGNKVYIRFSGNEKPVVVQGESENYKYLLMPVRAS